MQLGRAVEKSDKCPSVPVSPSARSLRTSPGGAWQGPTVSTRYRKRSQEYDGCTPWAVQGDSIVGMRSILTFFIFGIAAGSASIPSTAQTLQTRDDIACCHQIHVGDALIVRVWRQPSLSTRVSVDRGGKIDLPLLGKVTARGLTCDELARWCELAYAAHLRGDPHVAVELASLPKDEK